MSATLGTSRRAAAPAWTRQRERGSLWAMRLVARLGLGVGWHPTRLLLFPIAAWFLAVAPAQQRAAARRYLARALGRPAGLPDLYRLWLAFAHVVLERVFLLAGRTGSFRFTVHGEDAIRAKLDAGQGCVLLGAHLGSFSALRLLGDVECPVEVRALMYEDNAAQAQAFFNAIAPRFAAGIIALGRPDAMLRAKECLDRGGVVGMLADRAPNGERMARVPLLGDDASLPVGPHLLASVLGAPVVLGFALWTGPRRYEIRFEPFSDRIRLDRADRAAGLADSAARYAARLSALCREHPYNWFNFYDFWQELDPPSCEPSQDLRDAA